MTDLHSQIIPKCPLGEPRSALNYPRAQRGRLFSDHVVVLLSISVLLGLHRPEGMSAAMTTMQMLKYIAGFDLALFSPQIVHLNLSLFEI